MITATTTGNHADVEYDAYIARIQDRFSALTTEPLFTTDVDNLFAAYLAVFPDTERQYHNCSACRKFIDTYGGLVTIDERGAIRSALWDDNDTPELYQMPVRAMLKAIKRAKVTGVFVSAEKVYGTPITGVWHHFAVIPTRIHVKLTQTAFQSMAEKREDYATLQRALADFTPVMLQTAVTLLKTDSLYRSEKVLGVAEWLLTLLNKKERGIQWNNVVWRAVATAPAGYCHPRSSMIGTLLEDIASGMAYDMVAKRFAAKMHPLQYQRPQSAPSAGNIQQANKIIEQLQASGALVRRFARLEDIQAIWKPTPVVIKPRDNGVFDHLLPQTQPTKSYAMPAITMTWEKFQRTVLPTAQLIEYRVPRTSANYAALLTVVNPDAPLIFQWENPVSWYVYHNGSSPGQWGLTGGAYVPVTAITLQPSMWGEPRPHQGKSVIFLLDGCRDSYESSAGLFPEILRSEFHSIRATIEAYSRNSTPIEREHASACGIRLQKGSSFDSLFRVTSTDGSIVEYTLDRWD